MESYDQWNTGVAMVAICIALAIVNILMKEVVDEGMDHLVFIAYRQAISAVFLAPIGFFLERNSRPKLTLNILCQLFVSAAVGATLSNYFFLLGIQYTTATFACAFVNMVPVVTFMISLPFGLEKVNIKGTAGRAKLLATLVCIGGAILLTLYRGMPLLNYSHAQTGYQSINQAISVGSGKKRERWTLGSMALIAGTLSSASWFLVQSSVGKIYPCHYSSTAIMTFFGVIQSAVLCLSIERNLSKWILKGNIELWSVMYAGLVGSGLCYVGMSWSIKKKGPVFTAAFTPLIQTIAAILAVPVLHEQLYLGSLLGSIIVIGGLYILLWGKNREINTCASATKVAQETKEIIKEQEPQFQVIEVTCESRHP